MAVTDGMGYLSMNEYGMSDIKCGNNVTGADKARISIESMVSDAHK